MCQMVHTVYFFVCKLSARPQFSIFHFQLSILKNFRSVIICFFTLQTVFTNRERRLAESRIDFAVDLFDLCLDFAICSKPNAKINKEKNCTID